MTDAELDARVERMSDEDVTELASPELSGFAKSDLFWSRYLASIQRLAREVKHSRAQLARILAMTGQVRHADEATCTAAKCGCVSLTAEEAVVGLVEERDRLKGIVQSLADRVAAQSELLAKRAEVKG